MDYLEKYIELIIRVGINLKKNQKVVVSSPVDCKDFTRLLTKKAYEYGAKEVIIYWSDDQIDKIRYEMASLNDVFDTFPSWVVEMFQQTADEDSAYIRLYMPNPQLLNGLDMQRISRQQKAKETALKKYNEKIMSLKNSWCTIAVPTEEWAKCVFPGQNNAIHLLWKRLFECLRINSDDPVQVWKKHVIDMDQKISFLNKTKFKYLHYKNSIGTDLVIELPEGHFWGSALSETPLGQRFVANLPTEEIFTVPKMDGVNGKVVSSMPLNYNGCVINKIEFTFKNGEVVKYKAEEGEDALKVILESDEGAKRLGEVALVAYDSPISKLNTVFYNSLLDENASCHLALGKAYPMIVGAQEMDNKMRKEICINDSIIHVDFMVGTKDMLIIGIKSNGDKEVIFENGNWKLDSSDF